MTIPHLFHVRRFVLEANALVMIASGGDDPLLDTLLARDANGLPMIPATTLAGAIRAQMDDNDAKRLFGFQGITSGQRSALIFTDALAHCADDRPRDGWQTLPDDSVVKWLMQDSPITRQHVRLDEYGVTQGEGKFERSAVPAGTRFTFEISHWGPPDETAAKIVRKGLFLGGAKRSGYGGFDCVKEGGASFDLKKANEADAYRCYAAMRLDQEPDFDMNLLEETVEGAPGWHLRGTIEGPLLIGAPRKDGRGGRQPYSEARIDWGTKGATICQPQPIVPGSAIKGPLRHRTRFYLHKQGVEDADAQIDTLFGSASSGTRGRAGQLRFYDAVVHGGAPITLAHVSLDRFTGGARDKSGALFSDDMLWRPELEIRIDRLGDISTEAGSAFKAALDDLRRGVLGIGAEWGEGAGVFESLEVHPHKEASE